MEHVLLAYLQNDLLTASFSSTQTDVVRSTYVDCGQGIVAEYAVLDGKDGLRSLRVLEEQAVVPDTEAHHDIELSSRMT